MDQLDAPTEAVLRAFASEVIASPHNLVSRRAKEELWERHVLESVAFAHQLPARQRVLDVGSGGGFPGVVVAAVRPDLRVTLLESSTKKVRFLTDVTAKLDLDVGVLHGRAEVIAQRAGAASFDVVTARAVAPLPRLLDWTMPFLVDGGLLYAIKGESWADELDAAADALDRSRGQVVATPDEVPRADDHAPLVIVIKRGVAG